MGRVWEATRSALRLRFASLPTRIIVSVFAAAIVTGLAVTGIATRSTESFLHSKIDERFPALLRATSQRLERWYAQREVDLQTFATSDTVADSLDARRRPVRAREEARRYLAYVQEGFPQYRSLFVLGRDGEVHVAVGEDPGLGPALRDTLAETRAIGVGPVWGRGAERFQVISAPVERGGRRIGSLHAVVGIDAIAPLLGGEDAEGAMAVYVVDVGAQVVVAGGSTPHGTRYDRRLPEPGGALAVTDYTTPDGNHVVGCAMAFPRFGWSLVVEQDYDVAFAPVMGLIRKVLAINLGIVGAFGLIAFTIARSIARPIRALSDGARRIARGETDVAITPVRGRDEIGVLSRALYAMVERLRRNQVELQRKQAEIERANDELRRANDELRRGNEMLEQLSCTDGLTRLHNHRYFQDQFVAETRRADRSGESLALLLIDIDNFKALNDRYGHAVGDEVLRRVAMVLNTSVRETDLPARYGGEEFAVLLPRTAAEGAVTLAEKVRQSVGDSRFQGEGIESTEGISVTASIGVAVYRGDAKAFFNDADRALYRAKGSGKDCVVLASAD